MGVEKRLRTKVGKVVVTESSSLTDIGGQLTTVDNITGVETLETGIATDDFRIFGLLQKEKNIDIQFGGDDITTQSIPVGGEIVVDFTNLFDARLIGHTFRLNQGKIRFHVDVQTFDAQTIRLVNGDFDMEDIDFADATGIDNDIAMVYKNNFERYTEQQILTVTFYNVGTEPAIVRGGTIGGNPAPFIPYWRTTYFDITTTCVIPNGINGTAGEDIDQLQAVYISGKDAALPTFVPEMSLADASTSAKRPAVAIATEDILSGEKGAFAASGVVQDLDTSSFNAGDRLYLGLTGNLTATKPVGYSQFIGTVIMSDALQGMIDFDIESPVNGTLLSAASFNDQEPSLVDTALQVEYGAAQGSGSDPVSLAVDGTVTFNEDGFYVITFGVQYGRTTTNLTAIIHFRALINGTQVGNTATAIMPTDASDRPLSITLGAFLNVGDELTTEVIRDSNGVNDGGLLTVSVTASGWTDSPSASIRIYG